VAREVLGVRDLWDGIEALDGRVAADVQTDMLLAARRSVERATRWLLRTRPRPLDIGAESARYADGARTIAAALPGVLVEREQDAWRERVARLTEAGVPAQTAAQVVAQGALFSTFDIVEVAGMTGHPIEAVAALHFQLGGDLELHWLRDQIVALPRATRWQAMARAALRDDLFSLHAELTADVLRAGGIDEWLSANAAAAERAREILGEIRSGSTFDLTTLPVALREVRNLIGRG
jgi:glutamate dehydrogenase